MVQILLETLGKKKKKNRLSLYLFIR